MLIRNSRSVYTGARDAVRAALEICETPAPGRMRAWRLHAYGQLDELRLEEARVPPLRAPDEILVRVHAASINPLDVAMIGGYGARVLNALRSLEGSEGVEFPLVLGRDFAGEVQRAGPATRLHRGDFVWGVVPPHWPGSHAEYVTVKERWAGVAPPSLNAASAGGALYAAMSAMAALRAAGLPADEHAAPRERVLLLGLGGVGHAALQLLVRRGSQVVVGCSADRCELACALGATTALDRAASDYDRQLIEHGPYEAILDCAGMGGDEASARSWRFGRYVTLSSPLLRETDAKGAAAGAVAAAARLAAQSARTVASAPRGLSTFPPPHVRWAFFTPRSDDIELLRRLVDRNQFTVEVEQVYPWWEVSAAFARAARGHARGKLLLDFATPAPAL